METLERRIAKPWVILISLLLLFACEEKSVLPYYNTADLIPLWKKPGVAQHKIETFELKNQFGKRITNETLNGKITVANFFFATCPGTCPRMMNNLMPLQDVLTKDSSIVILSHSVTPWRDSVQALYQYGQRTGINSNRWHLLTGDKSTIYHLARHSYFAEEEPGLAKDSSQFLHTERVFLIDKEGFIRGVYRGTQQLDMQHLLQDLEILRKM